MPRAWAQDEPGQATIGQLALIEHVADEDDVCVGRRRGEQVGLRDGDRDAVGGGVHRHGGQRESVDVGGERARGASLHGGDGDQTGAGGEIDHALAAHDFGMIEDVTGERLAARPGERPERRRQPNLAELVLGALPQRQRFLRQMQFHLGHQRRR